MNDEEKQGLKTYRPQPTLEDALEAAKGLNDEPGINPEYERGQIELIIDLFAIEWGMDSRYDVAKALGWPGDRFK